MEAAEVIQAPEQDDVRRIAAMRDPILRNLEITVCYWRLAQAVARRTGVGSHACFRLLRYSHDLGHAALHVDEHADSNVAIALRQERRHASDPRGGGGGGG